MTFQVFHDPVEVLIIHKRIYTVCLRFARGWLRSAVNYITLIWEKILLLKGFGLTTPIPLDVILSFENFDLL